MCISYIHIYFACSRNIWKVAFIVFFLFAFTQCFFILSFSSSFCSSLCNSTHRKRLLQFSLFHDMYTSISAQCIPSFLFDFKLDVISKLKNGKFTRYQHIFNRVVCLLPTHSDMTDFFDRKRKNYINQIPLNVVLQIFSL